MTRLYEAAKKLKKVDGQSALAKFMNTSPQKINNWESRGISSEGLLTAQELIGCNAIWIRDGIGEMYGLNKLSQEAIEVAIKFDQLLLDNKKNVINSIDFILMGQPSQEKKANKG